jgi:hypothetical protein
MQCRVAILESDMLKIDVAPDEAQDNSTHF